jgi:hypothetical protein
VAKRVCAFRYPDGHPCGAPPLREGQFCRMHDPAYAAEVEEGRRLGGSRRKREATLQAIYDLDGIESVAGIRRLVYIVIADALSPDGSIPRGRLILQAAQVSAKLLETGELEERVAALEASKHHHDEAHRSTFDLDEDDFSAPASMPGAAQ